MHQICKMENNEEPYTQGNYRWDWKEEIEKGKKREVRIPMEWIYLLPYPSSACIKFSWWLVSITFYSSPISCSCNEGCDTSPSFLSYTQPTTINHFTLRELWERNKHMDRTKVNWKLIPNKVSKTTIEDTLPHLFRYKENQERNQLATFSSRKWDDIFLLTYSLRSKLECIYQEWYVEH